MSIRDLFLRLGSWSPIRYKAVKCGHRTKQSGRVSAFEQTITVTMPQNQNGSMDYCLDCIGGMAIQCAWCGDPIFIGEPITLYTPRSDFQVPEHAVVYNKEPIQLVGCLSGNCAETGIDRAGFWMPGENGKGSVWRVPTVLEVILGAKEPSAMIISDPSDMKEAMNPTVIPFENHGAK